jgi:hypothetical protein
MRLMLIALLALPAFGQAIDMACEHPDGDFSTKSCRIGVPLTLPVLGPYSVATNHTDDIAGTTDYRPGEIGTAGYSLHRIEFHPPQGYRVRVLRVYGDFAGWLRRNPSGNCVGTLWGLSTTAPEGSARATPAADNTFLYVQDSACGSQRNFRAPVDYKTREGGLLGPDHVLVSKVAVFWNETGEPVHLEPSFTIVYQFEENHETNQCFTAGGCVSTRRR